MLVEIWNRNIDISLLFLSVCFCFFLNKFTSVCGCFFYEIREILRRTLSYFFLEAMENAGNMDKLEEMVKLAMVQNWVADNCKQVEPKSDSKSDSKSE